MSWAQIFRFSRERQVPIIVTDEQGERPMVLLSLEQLEAALDGRVGVAETGGWTEETAQPGGAGAEEATPNFLDRAESRANDHFTTQEQPEEQQKESKKEAYEPEIFVLPETKQEEKPLVEGIEERAQSEKQEIVIIPEGLEEGEDEQGQELREKEPTNDELSLEERFYLEN